MRLSTRHQLAGTGASVDTGGVMAAVKVTLAPGRPVTVAVKSTEVMLAVDD